MDEDRTQGHTGHSSSPTDTSPSIRESSRNATPTFESSARPPSNATVRKSPSTNDMVNWCVNKAHHLISRPKPKLQYLPIEIRRQIWYYALVVDYPLPPQPFPDLLLVKAARDDAWPIFLRHNQFAVNIIDMLPDMPSFKSPHWFAHRVNLAEVEFTFNFAIPDTDLASNFKIWLNRIQQGRAITLEYTAKNMMEIGSLICSQMRAREEEGRVGQRPTGVVKKQSKPARKEKKVSTATEQEHEKEEAGVRRSSRATKGKPKVRYGDE